MDYQATTALILKHISPDLSKPKAFLGSILMLRTAPLHVEKRASAPKEWQSEATGGLF